MNGPANFYRLRTDPRDTAELFTRSLLGVRLECARCHSHPYDRWTQNDYYGLAGFFAGVRTEGVTVSTRPSELEHPKTGKPVPPRLLGELASDVGGAADRRETLAAWMDARNPFFSRSLVNRVWRQMFGRGLVEPVDDMRVTNPPSIPTLLDAATQELVRGGLRLRPLVRFLAGSRLYQLSSTASAGNRSDERLFSRGYVKALPAPVLVDAIARVTGVRDQFAGYAEGTRAVQLVDSQVASAALDVFGRCAREASCDLPETAGGGLAAALQLLSGETINARLGRPECITTALAASDRPAPELIEELFRRALARAPTEPERALCLEEIGRGPDLRTGLNDVLWGLLNTREFAFVH